MAELKTRPSKASVSAFINSIDDKQKRADARQVASMMRRATGSRARMWGDSIVGYGSYKYTNTKGKDLEWMLTGFSPRKQALTVYVMPGFSGYDSLMSRLGTYKTGKSCLYIKRLSDINEKVLEQLIGRSVRTMRKRYETK